MAIRSNDILVLLGAGASAETGIPVSGEMIRQVEANLQCVEEWKSYHKLYNHVKSAIYFSAGLKGRFNDRSVPTGNSVTYNIETLMNTLYELERNEDHPLYPFIAAWNSRFVTLAGDQFGLVVALRRQILAALKKWMCPEDEAKGDYYRGLVMLQRDLNFPLHVFSLNYDLCIERLREDGFRIETGFESSGPGYPWNWKRFEDAGADGELPQMFLYKLHGSINWKRDPLTKQLYCVNQIQSIEEHEMEVIFGKDFKMNAADPYLFFAYQFRQLSLNTRLILAIGYGFGDQHINKMLTQCLWTDPNRRLVVVQHCCKCDVDARQVDIAARLDLDSERRSQVIVLPGTASGFLETPELANVLTDLAAVPEEAPF